MLFLIHWTKLKVDFTYDYKIKIAKIFQVIRVIWNPVSSFQK